ARIGQELLQQGAARLELGARGTVAMRVAVVTYHGEVQNIGCLPEQFAAHARAVGAIDATIIGDDVDISLDVVVVTGQAEAHVVEDWAGKRTVEAIFAELGDGCIGTAFELLRGCFGGDVDETGDRVLTE